MTLLEEVAKELNLEEIEVDERLVDNLGSWAPCAKISIVNYTPWWGGDYRTYVRDPETLVPRSYPTAETIKGVLRWVLRAALNAHLDSTINELDSMLSRIYGGIAEHGEREAHLDSLVRIRVSVQRIGKDLIARCLHDKIRDFSRADNNEARAALGEAVEAACNVCREECVELKRYLKLLDVPRVRLAFMPIREEKNNPKAYMRRILGLLPVPPEELKLEVYIDVRRGFEAIEDGLTKIDTCGLTLYALVYALMIHGLGRASSRGFGRFLITDIVTLMEGLEDVGSDVRSWVNRLRRDNPDDIYEAINEIHKMLVERVKRLIPAGGHRRSKLHSPSLEPNDTKVIVKKVERIRDVYDALYVIGCATLKQQWKRAAGLSGSRPGVDLHTWLLGLPRWQQNTGYALIEDDGLDDDVCISSESLKVETGRRKSAFVIFPLPSHYIIAAIGYVTRADHEEALTKLYHVGAHTDNVPDKCLTNRGRNKKERGKRLSPLDVKCRHAVRVEHVLQNKQVGPGAPQDVCKGCCGTDPGGVYLLSTKDSKIQATIDDIYEQACEFIDRVLEQCTPPSMLSPSKPRQHRGGARGRRGPGRRR